ncbi:MAG TPA: hypothetical protein VH599_14475 [Ktedonobacterales bacterium]
MLLVAPPSLAATCSAAILAASVSPPERWPQGRTLALAQRWAAWKAALQVGARQGAAVAAWKAALQVAPNL